MSAIPSISLPELMTRDEIADYYGVLPVSLGPHVTKGRLRRVNPRGGRAKALYSREDVESLRPFIRNQMNAITLSRTEKACSKCRETLPISLFPLQTDSRNKPRHYCLCNPCKAIVNREYRKANWERLKPKFLRYYRLYRAIINAITDGKSSPVHKLQCVGGFSIVKKDGDENRYRAARRDMALLPGERILACYEFVAGVWCVSLPQVRSRGSSEITGWCHRYEARQKSKDGRLKKNMKKAGVS